jgi:hypothetical protein
MKCSAVILLVINKVAGQVMWDLWWTNGTGTGFIPVLRFPLLILIPPTATH